MIKAKADTSGRRILVAHSAGGTTIPLVAARAPVDRMVFAAAILPQPAQSIFEALAPGLPVTPQGFALRRRGIETGNIAGETVAAPDPVQRRRLAKAHVRPRALRDATSRTETARATGHSEPHGGSDVRAAGVGGEAGGRIAWRPDVLCGGRRRMRPSL